MNPSNNQQQYSSSIIQSQLDKQKQQIIKKSSSDFTIQQIELVRSYLSRMEISLSSTTINQIKNQDMDNVQNKNMNLCQIAQKIHKQTILEQKSIKEIQQLINKLLSSTQLYVANYQLTGKNYQQYEKQQKHLPSYQIKIQTMQIQHHSQDQKYQKMVLQTPKQYKQKDQVKMENQQIGFLSKSLFKSFNTPSNDYYINNNNKNNQGDGGDNGLFQNGLKKVNLFTRNQSATRKNSNGFVMSVYENPKPSINQQSSIQGSQYPSFGKKPTKQQKQPSSPEQKSRRKIRPQPDSIIDASLLTAQEKIGYIESNTSDCHSILERKLAKKNTPQSKQAGYFVNQRIGFVYNEYFYGNYDRAYFNQENQHLNKLYKQLDINPKRITFKQHKMLKKLLPKPKLFNIDFILTQQNKLNEFRTHLRQLPKDKSKMQDIELSVGRQVTALHPVCGHLHSGTILAIYKENQYMVKFTRPQLGTQKVLDINISTRSLLNANNKATIQNLDYEAMVIVIKLLEYKGDLLQRFKQYNGIIQESNKQGKQLDNVLLQEYGWIGSTINILSMGLRHILAKFRVRGLSQGNQDVVGKNFSSLLINPLNLMSKELENSSQMSDIQTSRQIKQLAHNRSTSRIESTIHRLSSKFSHYLSENEMLNPEQKSNMNSLVENLIAILLNLRYDGHNFNIESNKYMNNLIEMIDGEYTQYFNEIYTNLHSILRKVNVEERQE